jgi:hypothetical protein
MSLSNDSLEGKLVSRVLRRLADEDDLPVSIKEEILEEFEVYERIVDGLAFCLSESGDLLSQWRAYASDGVGVSIGLREAKLNELIHVRDTELLERDPTTKDKIVKLERIQYTVDEHIEQVRPFYEQARHLIRKREGLQQADQPAPHWPPDLQEVIHLWPETAGVALFFLFQRMFKLKSAAFVEEKEWRLLCYTVDGVSDTTDFRPTTSKLIPFHSLDLSKTPDIIGSVTIGPKHETDARVIKRFLNQHGHHNVEILRSGASYR